MSLYGAFKHAQTKIDALEVENSNLHTRLAKIEELLNLVNM
jgi:hypothetical protein